MNQLIRAHDQEAIFITGPGHGGPAPVAQAYLEGTLSEVCHLSRGCSADDIVHVALASAVQASIGRARRLEGAFNGHGGPRAG